MKFDFLFEKRLTTLTRLKYEHVREIITKHKIGKDQRRNFDPDTSTTYKNVKTLLDEQFFVLPESQANWYAMDLSGSGRSIAH